MKRKAKRKVAAKERRPPVAVGYCQGKLVVCRECKYRFRRRDKGWKCPKCKANRACGLKAMEGFPTCREHTPEKDRPPINPKFFVASQMREAYNAIVQNPRIFHLSQEMATVSSRTDRLFRMMEENDTSAAHREIMRGLNLVESGLLSDPINKAMGRFGLDVLRKAVEPVRVEWLLWQDIKDNLELARRISDTERRHAILDAEAIPVSQVIEMLVFFQRITLRYIPDSKARSDFARELRAAIMAGGNGNAAGLLGPQASTPDA